MEENDKNEEQDEELELKRNLLQKEIIEGNYNKEQFIDYCLALKPYGDDISQWTYEELKADDIYPKCPQTLNGLYQTKFGGVAPYAEFIKPIGGKPLKKTKRVFDTSKVTDHHAIIPTGVIPQNLSDAERNVFDLVARRFIGVFLPDCKFSTTTVLGEVKGEENKVEFKVTGKEILDPGSY